MNFNSHTDVAVRVAVALVNLLTPGEDRGRGYQPPEDDERTAASSMAPVLTASNTPRSSAATKHSSAASSQVASRQPLARSTAPTAAVRSSPSGGW